ncbi:MAG: AMP-binding protein [Actinomycetota bacterium]|nr:AMP-binding protein [Actinomycetota bacterium]
MEPGSVAIVDILRAIARDRPTAEHTVAGDRRLTWAETDDRSDRLAGVLASAGLGCTAERATLPRHRSGQHHLGILTYNRLEYLESMVGCWKARVAPFNINYRYGPSELEHLLTLAATSALVVQGSLAERVAGIVDRLPDLRLILQIDDGSGAERIPGALDYEEALRSSGGAPTDRAPSPDDLYLLFTGGTTGLPKGVMWRNGDAVTECFNGSRRARDLAEFVAAADTGLRSLPAAPFMHGAGHWSALRALLGGGTVIVPEHDGRLDPDAVWAMVDREQVNLMLIVGDAFARPLIEALDRGHHDGSSLNVLVTGGAALSPGVARSLLERLPTLMIVDGFGSSEAGGQMTRVTTSGNPDTPGFKTNDRTFVLSEDRSRILPPGDPETGWLARSGRLPLGYLDDAEATERTYPTIDEERLVVPGDRARVLADGTVHLLGRESGCINTGGEKVFAQEVELAVVGLAGVADCLVIGTPDERWGHVVTAVVEPLPSETIDLDTVRRGLDGVIADYKIPRRLVIVERIERGPNGKADYRWAEQIASA